jgi:DNA-binding transcriptional MerR regulator
LRYWETRFPQLKPLQRAGNRRYYRPADVALVQRIHRLLNHDGYTIRGVQQLLSGRSPDGEPGEGLENAASSRQAEGPVAAFPYEELRAVRETLAAAIGDTRR